MDFISKKTLLLILGITSIVCARTMFVFFDDPEGPNLLIVLVTALLVFLVSLAVFVFRFSDQAKLGLAILIQILTIVLLVLVEPFV